ncbi:DNA-processing protein DprA [Cognatishimia sp. F0-27]|uniref:DNA-processing protein DprA n=1 Tax=Cognatishimia sp. F0-27 TaxID=2816855 RepID=UPI001D0C46AC|nr:DNA-processing protein DprA [Cognatishimia sp. F0-27]MCC1492154.1 DNA-processing protein DprA [Cognatishimia sp. F0-27]
MPDTITSSNHPPLPPTTEDDRFSWLRLLRSRRVGVTTFWRLLAEHGSARAALIALPEVARQAGVMDYRICPEHVVEAELEAARRFDARMVCFGDRDYPLELAHIDDAPPILWTVGTPRILGRPMVAVVGARNASSLGLRMARTLSRGLAEAGLVVASGLARGIDTVAHHTALEQGTVAVMGGGVDVYYPKENRGLARDILDSGGALISEQPMGLQPMARHFPMRNRIVSGLSQAVVVVEAAAKSGSLITARAALEQGREVLAVPGHPFDARAGGCNMLIRDGARLVRSVEDVLEALPAHPTETPAVQHVLRFSDPEAPGTDRDRPQAPWGGPTAASQRDAAPAPDLRCGDSLSPVAIPQAAPETRSLSETAALHSQILARLGPAPQSEDSLIRDLGAPSQAVSPVLTDLELDGKIERQAGGLLSLVPPR